MLTPSDFVVLNQIELRGSGVRNVWLRENMQTCALRLHKKKSLSAAI
jgi:hypothetical protein